MVMVVSKIDVVDLELNDFLHVINVKSKVPDPPEFPAGRIYTASCQEEWEIMLEQLTQGHLTKNTQELHSPREIISTVCDFPYK